MNVVNLCFYAVGYYSGQTYEENVLISEEFYKKIEDRVSQMKIYISELDGKHSEVLGEIDVQPCDEKDIPEWYTNPDNDGESFREELYYLCEELGLDLSLDEENVDKYIKTLDHNINVTVSIKKSDKNRLLKFVESLKNYES